MAWRLSHQLLLTGRPPGVEFWKSEAGAVPAGSLEMVITKPVASAGGCGTAEGLRHGWAGLLWKEPSLPFVGVKSGVSNVGTRDPQQHEGRREEGRLVC